MKVKRFSARTSRDALNLVRQAFGNDAVVLSTKPCAEGIEVLAMAPESMAQIERVAAQPPEAAAPIVVPAAMPAPKQPLAQRVAARLAAHAKDRLEPSFGAPVAAPSAAPSAAQPFAAPARRALHDMPAERIEPVGADVEQLAMSTLSFQDYVRERMLRKRDAALKAEAATAAAARAEASPLAQRMAKQQPAAQAAEPSARGGVVSPLRPAPRREPPVLRDEVRPQAAARAAAAPAPVAAPPVDNGGARRDQQAMMNELREVKGLIEERFGALAFMEKLQRQPARARLTQRLLECGFSAALVRKLGESLNAEVGDEMTWAANVLQRNLAATEAGPGVEDEGGIFALVGATGVGKTTTTAKIAAAFATKYGAGHLGLITLDAYRVGAHEQLRAYGRILGVPVHTAHDRASLEDLLDLLSAKKMVLIDTAGMAQRDSRTRELLDMLSHRAIRKLVVVNAAAQGETTEDVLLAYGAAQARGVVLSKVDEAVKLAPALDALIRHKLQVVGVGNGQRVPEDWHRLSAQALVQRALHTETSNAWHLDSNDVNLIFVGASAAAGAAAGRLA